MIVSVDGALQMTGFFVLMVVCGAIASLWLGWGFVSLAGVLAVPVFVAAMVWTGIGPASAVLYAFGGFALFQFAYALTGWGAELWRRRSSGADTFGGHGHSGKSASAKPPSGPSRSSRRFEPFRMSMNAQAGRPMFRQEATLRRPFASPKRTAGEHWPFFGGWLPLIAFYDPPCRSDGSPWNGREDPGYRITTLVFAWLGRGVSILIGSPRRRIENRLPPSDAAISALDDRIHISRLQDSAKDRHSATRD